MTFDRPRPRLAAAALVGRPAPRPAGVAADAIPTKPEAGTVQDGHRALARLRPMARRRRKKGLFETATACRRQDRQLHRRQGHQRRAGQRAARRRQHRDPHRAWAWSRPACRSRSSCCSTVDDRRRHPRRQGLTTIARPQGQVGRLRARHDERHPAALRARPERHEVLRHQAGPDAGRRRRRRADRRQGAGRRHLRALPDGRPERRTRTSS